MSMELCNGYDVSDDWRVESYEVRLLGHDVSGDWRVGSVLYAFPASIGHCAVFHLCQWETSVSGDAGKPSFVGLTCLQVHPMGTLWS